MEKKHRIRFKNKQRAISHPLNSTIASTNVLSEGEKFLLSEGEINRELLLGNYSNFIL